MEVQPSKKIFVVSVTAEDIVIDVEGLIEANSRGYAPGTGEGVGRSPVGGLGGSGTS